MTRYEVGLIGVGATVIVALAVTVVMLVMANKGSDSRAEVSPSQSDTQDARTPGNSNLKSKIATTPGLVVPVAGNSSAPLRKQPGFGTQVLQQLPPGTRIVARQWQETPGKNTPDRWYEIALEADASVSGWMHGDVLQFQQDSSNRVIGAAATQPRPAPTTDLPS
ncbi:hypothetical protein [Chondromyces apiculatus]|uniref:hypothetical protein n=1 Tax=Chondromyces apiculatus TaxID=51 RepID=UPI0012DCF223|nr:hypothetical protein [Chondromyces apiculatus]